jgi:uncharacterized membrane protein
MFESADIIVFLSWLGALYVCSLIGSFLFIKPDSNYSVLRYATGKSVGVIGISAIIWILSLFKIVSFSSLSIWILAALAFVITIYLKRKVIFKDIRHNYKNYLVIEVVFLLIFTIGTLMRAANPRIEGVEKFMDSAILSNLLRHEKGIPIDTWYAPEAINYYYFGHFIIATIAKFARVSVQHAFNLGPATVMAFSGTIVFCLAWGLAKKKLAGILALFLAIFASNLHPFVALLSGKTDYFFFNSGRFIEDVINEYPFYSFVLGDLHAQMLALIISTAIYGVIVLMALEKVFKYKILMSALAGGLVALAGAANSFDVISSGIVFILVISWLRYSKKINTQELFKLGAVFAVAFGLLIIPFLLSFNPGIGGVAVDLFKTPLTHILLQFGLPIFLGVVSYFVLQRYKDFKKSDNVQLAFVLGLGGLVLVLIPEFVYLKDIYFYENPPFARANTVFKIWYSAWILIAVSSSALIFLALKKLKKRSYNLLVTLIIIASFILAFGTFKGFSTLIQDGTFERFSGLVKDNTSNTLNGFAYLQNLEPNKLEIISWVNNNIDGQPLTIQASGESYTTLSWFSSYTGLPSTLGWSSHEWGWRYSADRWSDISYRMELIQKLYESSSVDELKNRTGQMGAEYILIGPDEFDEYNIDQAVFNQAFGQPVFNNSIYSIYKVN